jgi:hypothetical protein
VPAPASPTSVVAAALALDELLGAQEALVLTLGDGLTQPSSVAP